MIISPHHLFSVLLEAQGAQDTYRGLHHKNKCDESTRETHPTDLPEGLILWIHWMRSTRWIHLPEVCCGTHPVNSPEGHVSAPPWSALLTNLYR